VSGHGRNSRIPISPFLKPQHSSDAYPHHAGWEAKVALLFPLDAHSVRCPSFVSVVRTARQIRPDPAHQIYNHTFLLLVHMGVPRGMENVARTKRRLDRLLSAPARLVNWRLGGWSVALINPAQVVSKRCVRAPLQSTPINSECVVPVIHATSPSTTIRNAMTQHSKILTTALVCYTTSAVAFTFFHVISSQQTANGGFRFFVKSKFVPSVLRWGTC